MIKIRPYTERSNREEILGLYLYMVASVTPFYPEDVLGEKRFLWNGEWKTVEDFRAVSKKRTRFRKEAYNNVLLEYGIIETGKESREEKLDHDAALAKKIIKKYSDGLYAFLYKDVEEGSFHVNRENLRILLITAIDNEDFRNKIQYDFIRNPERKNSDKQLLEHVFRYDKFSKMREIYQLVTWLGVEVCPYCNRSFTTTLQESKPGEEGKVRAELDHYKSKSVFPYLSLSLLNMVPSCTVCNRIKHDDPLPVLYPYGEEMGEDYIFETSIRTGVLYLTGVAHSSEEFDLVGKKSVGKAPDFYERLDHSLKVFGIEKLYQSHKEYVINLFFQAYVFGQAELESLCERFPELFHDIEEVKSMLYLMDVRKENWGKRPLAKLTHDIDKEISRLTRSILEKPAFDKTV